MCFRAFCLFARRDSPPSRGAAVCAVPAAAFGIALTALFAGYAGMFRRAADLYLHSPEEDMSFAWFVPLVSLYALWRDREGLVAACRGGRFSWGGLFAALPLLAMGLLGARGQQLRLEQIAFAGLCVAVPWTFRGWGLARRLLFPAGYLLFMVPLTTFLNFATIHLRQFAVGAAFSVLRGFGVEAVREGTALTLGGAHPFAVDVATPCSGLRSLFALGALTAAYAHFTLRAPLRRWALFACAVPLAVLGNVARILTICLVAAFADADFALGFYHDYSGYVVFAAAITAMVAIGEVLDRWPCAK